MGENSKISWTDHTFNPWIGCTKVDQLCKFCYAEHFAERYGYAKWGPAGKRQKTADSNWKKPYSWARKAKKLGIRYRVFCASLADVFDDHESIKQEWRDELWKMIRETPHLDWLLLTKRPENFEKFLPADWGQGYPNVWLGVSAGDQDGADTRIPVLTQTPAFVRFISCEPMLGSVDLSGFETERISWVIVGGESGAVSKIRKINLLWVKSLKEQCEKYNLKFYFKQLGSILAKEYKLRDKWGANYDDYPQLLDWLKVRQIPDSNPIYDSFKIPEPEEINTPEINFED